MSGGAKSDRNASGQAEHCATPFDLRSLFETYYASIWRLLRRLGVPLAQLDDASQEVFWVAARRFKDIEAGREHAFLFGVALRIAANLVRRNSTQNWADAEQLLGVADPRPTPEDRLQQRQLRQVLDDVLSSMADDLRTVLVLHEIEGLDVRQVAEIVGIPLGTASSRLRRAREEFSVIAKRVRAMSRRQVRCV
jgi:RNA polymerase sigma-70 factor (ECF subfamily)